MMALQKYNWPGNIRELENVIEHAFVLESAAVIGLSSLPENILEAAGISLVESMENMANKLHTQTAAIRNSSQTISLDKLSDKTNLSDENDETDFDENVDITEDTDDNLEITAGLAADAGLTSSGPLDFNLQKEEFEKQFIIKALKTFKGRINQTALHANIPKKTLLRKIEKYGIVAKEYADTNKSAE